MLRPAGVVWLDALLARSSPIEQSAGASEGGDVAATVAEDAPVLIHLRAARAVPRLPLAYQEAITPISSCGLGIGLASTVAPTRRPRPPGAHRTLRSISFAPALALLTSSFFGCCWLLAAARFAGAG